MLQAPSVLELEFMYLFPSAASLGNLLGPPIAAKAQDERKVLLIDKCGYHATRMKGAVNLQDGSMLCWMPGMIFILCLSSFLPGPFRRSSRSALSDSLQSPQHKTAFEALGEWLAPSRLSVRPAFRIPRLPQVFVPLQKGNDFAPAGRLACTVALREVHQA